MAVTMEAGSSEAMDLAQLLRPVVEVSHDRFLRRRFMFSTAPDGKLVERRGDYTSHTKFPSVAVEKRFKVVVI